MVSLIKPNMKTHADNAVFKGQFDPSGIQPHSMGSFYPLTLFSTGGIIPNTAHCRIEAAMYGSKAIYFTALPHQEAQTFASRAARAYFYEMADYLGAAIREGGVRKSAALEVFARLGQEYGANRPRNIAEATRALFVAKFEGQDRYGVFTLDLATIYQDGETVDSLRDYLASQTLAIQVVSKTANGGQVELCHFAWETNGDNETQLVLRPLPDGVVDVAPNMWEVAFGF